jgi:L-histidine Nalpha-methyltransferase
MTETDRGSVRIDVLVAPGELAQELVADAQAGLLEPPRSMPPKWIYDAYGLELFDRITRLPEYYLTRAETAILRERCEEIASLTRNRTLVELGSGTSEKTRILLDALAQAGVLERFVPVDLSEGTLRAAADRLVREHPGLAVHGIVGDLERHLDRLPASDGEARMVAFLGSTIGNLRPPERARLLHDIAGALEPGGWLLLGTDLVKEPQRLVAAYDDSAGVTADFNRNLLRVVDRELGADFDADSFAHVARWNGEREWIELALRAGEAQRVTIAALDARIEVAAGEEILTEISAKFSREGVDLELERAGFELLHWWTDAPGDFALSLARLRSRA